MSVTRKRKIFLVALTLVAVFAVFFALTACGGKGKKNAHEVAYYDKGGKFVGREYVTDGKPISAPDFGEYSPLGTFYVDGEMTEEYDRTAPVHGKLKLYGEWLYFGTAGRAGEYTYRGYLSAFPSNWNPHEYRTATDRIILDYIHTGFYGFDYTADRSGYEVVPMMASDFPVDVSADYDGGAGWNIPEGATGRAWKIPLRDDLKWEDGTRITANDFVESARRLLYSKAQNYRADSLYGSNLVVAGAKSAVEGKNARLGVLAPSDTELVLVLERELGGFYLQYALFDSWLVKTGLYDSCTSEKGGVYANHYGTSVSTTPSCGPYKLQYFQADKAFRLVKNGQFYGYNDPENAERYQTTAISYRLVASPSTALQMFEAGELDGYTLTANEVESYRTSESTYYSKGESTFFMVLNPSEKAYQGTPKMLLTIPEFKMALSFGLDRAGFCLAASPINGAAYGVFSSAIVADPETRTHYRDTPEARRALLTFWGLIEEIGEGKLYADEDEALGAITGYNPAKAKRLFDEAYEKALSLGYLKAGDKVEITVGQPNATSTFYNNGYQFIVNNYTRLTKGTKLEGKLRFTRDTTLGNAFATALRENKVDLLFGVGWSGSALDPYSLVEAYVKKEYRYNAAWDTENTPLTIAVDGVDYTASVAAWTSALTGTEITATYAENGETKQKTLSFGTNKSNAERLPVLAALESTVLSTYDILPLMDSGNAELKGKRLVYGAEEFVFGLGYGGVKYYCYTMDDKAWSDYVKKEGGKLNYK